jgi:hypothetical protein
MKTWEAFKLFLGVGAKKGALRQGGFFLTSSPRERRIILSPIANSVPIQIG